MTIVLTRSDVERLLSIDECIGAVETAFIDAAMGRAPRARSLGFPSGGGGFHVKAARLDRGAPYFAAKLNGNFPANRDRGLPLPTIQGVILLSDAENGRPLAVMDSIAITILRTGAATAVAARVLAKSGASTIAIVGCGSQGLVSLRAISRVREVRRALVWDIDPSRASSFGSSLPSSVEPQVAIEVARDVRGAARDADIVVTCTPSKAAFLGPDDVRPGAFIAAVGADNETKSEIAPALMARAAIVTDDTEQCARIGDLHHAIGAGTSSLQSVRAELGEVLAGLKPGRLRDDEVVVFDSTGTALQDVAAAAIVYERAAAAGMGTNVDLAS